MKKTALIILLYFCLFCIGLNAQRPLSKADTLYYKTQIPFVKSDTLKINLIANDRGVTKVTAYHVNCVRYAAGTTWRSIKNFGKIRILTTGACIVVTTKPVDSVVYAFQYSAEGICGTSSAWVYVLDSMYWYLRDTSKVWTTVGYYPNEVMGYYHTETVEGFSFYFIVLPDKRRINITSDQYVAALTASGKL